MYFVADSFHLYWSCRVVFPLLPMLQTQLCFVTNKNWLPNYQSELQLRPLYRKLQLMQINPLFRFLNVFSQIQSYFIKNFNQTGYLVKQLLFIFMQRYQLKEQLFYQTPCTNEHFLISSTTNWTNKNECSINNVDFRIQSNFVCDECELNREY